MTSDAEPVPHILTILASTRQGRFGDTVARWLFPLVERRDDLTAELVDLRAWLLPYYDRPIAAAASTPADYEADVQPWAQLVGKADGFLVITPEYNHGYPAALKSALDAVYAEWNRKPIAFASYGGWSGGTRAVEQLRQVAIELQMAPVRNTVALPFAKRTFDAEGNPPNPDFYHAAVTSMLDDLAWWAAALKHARLTR
ncbi:MAG TPA: NAD(P)H-dependent oxidoreductase [Chloroflexota bacterium]|nr:NAD(P)H-dependent oxidoreductase [Chloroflexota bacterium]